MRQLFLVFLALALCVNLSAQLKISSTGNIGIDIKGPRPSQDFFPNIPRQGGSHVESQQKGYVVYRNANGGLVAIRKNSNIFFYQDAIDDSLEYWTENRKIFLKFMAGGYRKPEYSIPDSTYTPAGRAYFKGSELFLDILSDH